MPGTYKNYKFQPRTPKAKPSQFCPLCKQPLVNPTGPPSAKIGLIGEFPGYEELHQLKPFVGEAGRILQLELGKIGISLWNCRVTNLWMHEQSDSDEELSWHLSQAIKWVSKCRAVLLMGSEVTQAFLEENVMAVSGMKVKVPLLGDKIIVCSPNPAILMHTGKGELVLALNLFKKLITKGKLL